MKFVSRNPATEDIIATYDSLTKEQRDEKLNDAVQAFVLWSDLTFDQRAIYVKKLGQVLKDNALHMAQIAAAEMGKTVTAAQAELEKCADTCTFYAQNAAEFLKPEHIQTDASESYVQYDPLGVILAVMPWNFPYWQVIRFAAPTLMAGNVGILKHASNVSGCALALQEAFDAAGFPPGVFQTFLTPSDEVADLIKDPRVAAVTLTGSETAGKSVARAAGEALKKSVLELGGSDPFIVLEDADLNVAVPAALAVRMQNVAGQSCIAAKRFIVVDSIADTFVAELKKLFVDLTVGDPFNSTTHVGPLATDKILAEIERQVDTSVSQGAVVVTGGKRMGNRGYFYSPTILDYIQPAMPVYTEETFGPVVAVIRVANAAQAIQIANDTSYGLGASIWTADVEAAKQFATRIQAGCVFVNGKVKSDARLPFGGIKRSGYGRELSSFGIREFVNVKTVWVG